MIMIKIIALVFLFSCSNQDTSIDKKKTLGSDYRLFQNTPAWELAKSVKEGDTNKIRVFIKENKELVDYRDPVYGQTLLKMAVYNRNYYSVITLLELGADPNKQDYHDALSPVMEAASLGGGGSVHPFADPRYLKILLKYGGDPNAVQNGDKMKRNKTYFTPLNLACLSGIFEYVQILVNAGANVNYDSKQGFNSLYASTVGGNPKITLFLLKKGADFKQPMYINAKGGKKYLLDAIKIWNFNKESEEYKEQIEIIDFLKNKK